MTSSVFLNPGASVSVQLHGQARLSQKLDTLTRSLEDALDEVVFRAAQTIEDTAKQSMTSGGAKMSSPGMPPNRQSGRLVGSLSSRREARFQASVGSRGDAPHGLWLEYGTSTTEPRPWLGPALWESLPGIFEDVQQQLRKSIRDVTFRGEIVNKESAQEGETR